MVDDNSSDIANSYRQDLERYFMHLGQRVERVVLALPADKLWVRPFPFGNSVGHLVVHVTGSLNHYVGVRLAHTGYVRNCAAEFKDPGKLSADQLLERFRTAINLVVTTLRSLTDEALAASIGESEPIHSGVGLFIVCVAHLNNHIGQMSYLVQAHGCSTHEEPSW